MARDAWDLSHSLLSLGRVGQIQCLDVIPVAAGDSIGGRIAGVVRLSPLRRPLTLESRLSLYLFYVPHRHVYGEKWRSFLQGGIDESIDLTTRTVGQAGIGCIPGLASSGTYPAWTIDPINMIWNRYFRDPRDSTELVVSAIPGSASVKKTTADLVREYGYPACHLPHIANTGNRDAVADADQTMTLSVESNATKFTLPSLDQLRARYNTEEERSWFARRYVDILRNTWGTTVNLDADQRPELFLEHHTRLGGYDVDGTSDENLGTYLGKAFAQVQAPIRRKFFPEHGSVWLLALLRFPPLYDSERHYLQAASQPTYAEIAQDPRIDRSIPPVELHYDDLFSDGSNSASAGRHPWGQWHRTHPHRVHRRYPDLSGFPLLSTPSSYDHALYDWSYASGIFSTMGLEHWQYWGWLHLTKYARTLTSPSDSIFVR